MRVRAKGDPQKWVGYYNYVRRRGGAVFDLVNEKDFSKTWMERVDETTPKTPAPGEPTPAEIAAETKRIVGARGRVTERGGATGDREVI